MKYLQGTIGTMGLSLCYGGYPEVLEGYSDANWISDSDETKSTKWIYFYPWWWCYCLEVIKHSCIARSTMEAEFIALDLAGFEAEWLRNFLADIPL